MKIEVKEWGFDYDDSEHTGFTLCDDEGKVMAETQIRRRFHTNSQKVKAIIQFLENTLSFNQGIM